MYQTNRGFIPIIFAFIVAFAVAGGYVYYTNTERASPEGIVPEVAKESLTKEQKLFAASKEVLQALAVRDYEKLETLVSADGLSVRHVPGLDFSKNDVSKNEVSEIAKNTNVYLFGYTDGRGDPINLTLAEYLTKYIYTHDYWNAPEKVVNKTAGGGNSLNTLITDASSRDFVAFHYSGFNPEYAGMDWTTMYLVFDFMNGEYKLRGIAKDNWTI